VNQRHPDLNAEQLSIITEAVLVCHFQVRNKPIATGKWKKIILIKEEIRKARKKTPKKMPTVVPESLPSKIRSYPPVPQT
jgi:hypothetical protein